MKRTKINFLKVEDYEHPWDRAARNTLESMPGFTAGITKLNEIGLDRLLRIQYTGSSLKVTKKNLPELHDVLEEACKILSVKTPDLYLQWGFAINGFTSGVEKPIIVLNSGCIDLLSRDELMFVISHELGHIKNKHVLYYQTAMFLPTITQVIENATFGIGGLLSSGVQLALLNWSRMSELSADRAGLLGCQSPRVAINAIIKMAGLPQKYFSKDLIEEFIQQSKEFSEYDYDALDQIAKVLGIMNQSHPWTVMRASELLKWEECGEYSRTIEQKSWKKMSEGLDHHSSQQHSAKPWHGD